MSHRRTTPTHLLRHCGQRKVQHASWLDGSRVTRRQLRGLRAAGLVVPHVIHEDGQVVLQCATPHWYDPTAYAP